MGKVLAGDIGRTKTRLAIDQVSGHHVNIEREAEYPSRDYATYEVLLADFLRKEPAPASTARAA